MIQHSRFPLEQTELFPTEAPLTKYLPLIESLWKEKFPFHYALVSLFRIGSHSHGTYIPPEDPHGIDDVDFMAVVIPPFADVVGLNKFEHCLLKDGPIDCIVYEWSKYLSLLEKSNPNVVGTLWLDKKDVYCSSASPYRYLVLKNRSTFMTKALYPAFIGYAKGQMYKMTHYTHQGYMGDKRKQIVAKYGYDVKNAAHMIRLLRMGVEALETGTMKVLRPDAHEIISIKKGEWTIEQVIREATLLFDRAEKAMVNSTLPDKPDRNKINNMVTDGYLNWWPETNWDD